MTYVHETIKINGVELLNRLVMPPMATSKSDAEGGVTQALCDYYDEKSRGGHIGLIITEHGYVSPEGKASKGQLSIADDSVIDGLQRLVSAIHHNHTKVFAQINHAGGAATREITGREVISASSVVMQKGKGQPARAMEKADIARVTDCFARAAGRVKKAGFDGVEIHSAHAYLLNQFYSPLTNQRKDEYNGTTIEGRIRLHLEIIKAVRDIVGKDYPIALRLGACDYMDGGSTIADSVLAAKRFEEAGLDLLDISGGLCGYRNPFSTEQGYFSEITEAIKKEISIPVILTGGITEADAVRALLWQNKADLIGVGRAILKNSEFPLAFEEK